MVVSHEGESRSIQLRAPQAWGKKLAPSVSLEQGEQQDRETQLNQEMRLMVEERRIYQFEVRFSDG